MHPQRFSDTKETANQSLPPCKKQTGRANAMQIKIISIN